ncbi:MAG TPA: F0F1 ATP synthase subunit delta [Verrucomicrobiae bacterium]|nr:F0F1 ATP synthase subunit delta [Verrucomicrobiae bacterium]
MLIDWFTAGAQAVNFLILVWLLKRFLYQPILQVMAEREKLIAGRLKDAEIQKALAEKEREEWQRRTQEFEGRQAALLHEAVAQANVQRQSLIKEARKEAEAERTKWRESLRQEQEAWQRELTERVQREVFAIARKALTDLAATGIEERMAEMFEKKLRGLDDEAKRRLTSSLKSKPFHAVISSASQLSEPMQLGLQQAVGETLAAEVQIQFKTAPDLIGGIELEMGGEKVAWSISNYLAALEQSVKGLTAGQEATHAGTT